MSEMKEFKAGDTCFTFEGYLCQYVARLDNNRHAVLCISSSDEEEFIDDTIRIVTRVYETAPTYIMDETVEALSLSIKQKRQELAGLRNQIAEQQLANKETQDKFKNHKVLHNLSDFLDGNITHFVTNLDIKNLDTYTLPEVKTFDEVMQYQDDYNGRNTRYLRLLSLYGDSKGDLSYRVSCYKDGSGSHSPAIPCTSLEEAQEIARKYGQIIFDKWSLDRQSQYIAKAQSLGLKVPEAAIKLAKDRTIASAKEEFDRHEAYYLKAKAKLEELTK